MLVSDIHRKDQKGILHLNSDKESDEIPVQEKKNPSIHDIQKKKKYGSIGLQQSSENKKIILSALDHKHRLDRKQSQVDSIPKKSWPFQIDPRHPLFPFAIVGIIICVTLNLIFPVGTLFVLRDNVKAYATNNSDNLDYVLDIFSKGQFSEGFGFIDQIIQDFQTIENQLQQITPFLNSPTKEQTELTPVYLLLQAGQELIHGAEKFSMAVQNLQQLWQDMTTNPLEENKAIYGDATRYLEEQLVVLQQGMDDFHEAEKLLDSIEISLLPTPLQEEVEHLRAVLREVSQISSFLETYQVTLLDFLGAKLPKRYVILLQNQDEMRATGGFIGSMYFIQFDKGWLTESYFKDVYDLDGQITTHMDPPYGLTPITQQYGLRDSNYSPDFPTAADNVISFVDLAKGPKLDGVFALNQQLVIDLLEIVGPVELSERELILTADNFSVLTSYIVESKVDQAQPKTIVKEFVPLLFEKLQKTDIRFLLDTILKHIGQRNIVLSSVDSKIQSAFEEFGLDGSMRGKQEKEDYLMLVDTSVSGNKSDRYIQQHVEHETFVDASGKVINRLTIERSHTFNELEKQRWQDILNEFNLSWPDEWLETILGNGKNRSYLRVYVPEGTKLLDSIGVEQEEIQIEYELGKTYFGFFVEVEPSSTGKIMLSYELPFELNVGGTDTYKLVMEKQVGGRLIEVEKKILVDDILEIENAYPPHTLPFSSVLENTLYTSHMIGVRP